MTKYIYHLTPNAFEELPGMEKPEMEFYIGRHLRESWEKSNSDYNAHLSTLHDGQHNPMIPGSPECREVFADGQVVEKEMEIAITAQPFCLCGKCNDRGFILGPEHACAYCNPDGAFRNESGKWRGKKLVAAPICTRIKSDNLKEEQWKIHYDYVGNLAFHLGITIDGELWEKKALPYLEKFYHLTRK